MNVVTTAALYHKPGGNGLLLRSPKVRRAATEQQMTEDELDASRYEPCSECFPNQQSVNQIEQ
jgi:hypothetical protein